MLYFCTVYHCNQSSDWLQYLNKLTYLVCQYWTCQSLLPAIVAMPLSQLLQLNRLFVRWTNVLMWPYGKSSSCPVLKIVGISGHVSSACFQSLNWSRAELLNLWMNNTWLEYETNKRECTLMTVIWKMKEVYRHATITLVWYLMSMRLCCSKPGGPKGER